MASEIIYGLDLTERINETLKQDNVFIITDDNVYRLYTDLIDSAPHFVFAAGEASKTLETYSCAMEEMLACGCNRATIVVAIGGGVVGDLAGFVAASYMRGVKWINVPTTLLSQVDSSVGGKTAVNLNDYKNIIGAFHLPEKVLISTHFLNSLDDREWLCGVGEIVKTAFLSRTVNSLVASKLDKLLKRDASLTYECVRACVAYKEEVVQKDLYENGLRKSLNLGHTIGHAIETTDGHRKSHGEYVLMGLAIEAFLLRDRLGSRYDEIIAAVNACGIEYPDFDAEAVAMAATKDKKNGSGTISIMLADYENTSEIKLSFDEVYGGLNKWKSNR